MDFFGDRQEPSLESIKRRLDCCGAEARDGVAAIKRLLTAGRAKGLPSGLSRNLPGG